VSEVVIKFPICTLTDASDCIPRVLLRSYAVHFMSELLLQMIKEVLNGSIRGIIRSSKYKSVLVIVHQEPDEWILVTGEIITNESVSIVNSSGRIDATLAKLVDNCVKEVIGVHDSSYSMKGNINPTSTIHSTSD
jgi:hypothetical protein